MPEIERKRRLRIGAAVGADTRRGPAERALPIGSDREPSPRDALRELDRDAVAIAGDRERASSNSRKLQLRRARGKRGEEMAVLDVVAERVEPDLGGGEADLGGAQQPPTVVHNADCSKRRGVRLARLPDAERHQRGHRTREQRGGAMIVRRRRRDQQRFHAGCRQRDSADETRRPAADDRNFGRELPGAIHGSQTIRNDTRLGGGKAAEAKRAPQSSVPLIRFLCGSDARRMQCRGAGARNLRELSDMRHAVGDDLGQLDH